MARIPVPAAVKQWLVPVWNAGHRLSWHAYDTLHAIVRGQFERCCVCGRSGLMIYRRRVIPPRLAELWGLSPRLAKALARKESCDCIHCGAKLRGRRLARVVMDLYPIPGRSVSPRSLAAWARAPEIRALRIAEINRIDGIHDQLRDLPGFQSSDFRPDVPTGTVVNGVRSEDLTRLSYRDASFDLILTSETLEHVPDLGAALREIERVLAPGGRHVFTIPVLPRVERTFTRPTIRDDGTIDDKTPRICHPGGDIGYVVFTEFGADISTLLARAGFEVEIHFGPTRIDDLAQVYVCRKPIR